MDTSQLGAASFYGPAKPEPHRRALARDRGRHIAVLTMGTRASSWASIRISSLVLLCDASCRRGIHQCPSRQTALLVRVPCCSSHCITTFPDNCRISHKRVGIVSVSYVPYL